jgi:hypothetical protein
VGGSIQSYLPTLNGRVVAACLRTDTNPDAPDVILPGRGPDIEAAADLLVAVREPVPTFIKRRANDWEYVGMFRPRRRSIDLAEIAAYARRAGRTDVSSIIWMERVK